MKWVKVCFWNIMNYGGGEMWYRWGMDSRLRNTFIAFVLLEKRIDVLMICEASLYSPSSLVDLTRTLNRVYRDQGEAGDWAVSLCGSAVTSVDEDPPRLEQVDFATDRRVEGYAVLWRTQQTDRFKMVPAARDIDTCTFPPRVRSPLNISTRGRPAGREPIPGRPGFSTWGPTGGYVDGNEFPSGPAGTMNSWPPLEMPTTSPGNPDGMSCTGVRRPVYVVLDLQTGSRRQEDRLCPVSVYHAPSWAFSAEFGVIASSLCRELYVTNPLNNADHPRPGRYLSTRRNVLGGDFNYTVRSADWGASYYRYFTDPRLASCEGGAGCEAVPPQYLPDVRRHTNVSLLEPDHVTPIRGTSTNDYFRWAIDLGFYSAVGSQGERIDVLDMIRLDRRGLCRPLLTYLNTHLTEVSTDRTVTARIGETGPEKIVKDGVVPEYGPVFSSAWGGTFLNWEEFMRQTSAGSIRDARRAAELYTIFISDHLPVEVDLGF